MFSKGSKDWNHSLASPSRVRQNLWTFTSSIKWWEFIQSLECSKCASALSSGFPENSYLKLDQFICKCCCSAASWFFCWFCCCWFYCWFCPCLWLGAAAPSSLSAILILIYNLFISYPCLSCSLPISFFCPRCDTFIAIKFQLIPDAWIWWFTFPILGSNEFDN